MGGAIGNFAGIPVVENRAVPKDTMFIGTGAKVFLVTDALRFNVRWKLHEYINRRVYETYIELGLVPDLRRFS